MTPEQRWQAARFVTAMYFGYPLFFRYPIYVPASGVILGEIVRERRGHFNLIHTESGLKADFYTVKRDEPPI
ncbi:MAG: hypothetical protein JWN25_2529 [Verrucomicrobiales bacterium]|nr:hypothetical protein [Verrucomicrobiales bacterium]